MKNKSNGIYVWLFSVDIGKSFKRFTKMNNIVIKCFWDFISACGEGWRFWQSVYCLICLAGAVIKVLLLVK